MPTRTHLLHSCAHALMLDGQPVPRGPLYVGERAGLHSHRLGCQRGQLLLRGKVRNKGKILSVRSAKLCVKP
eukprot:1157041-Pelagomonas_calceolata.AAC.10